MSTWSLTLLLSSLHDDIQHRLAMARRAFQHPGTKGDATEGVWLNLLQTYLPQRYQVTTAHVVDSEGTFSDQIDVVVFDRQYSPFIFKFQGQTILPAESVYAVFESKQSLSAGHVDYAKQKIASVRRLTRTSLPIPHAGGIYDPKAPQPILGGLLTLDSDWTPPLGQRLHEALAVGDGASHLDIGCVAAHGVYWRADDGSYFVSEKGKPATAFLLELIARLQATATVPMIDVRSYARWLAD